jgi:hypothetical protein
MTTQVPHIDDLLLSIGVYLGVAPVQGEQLFRVRLAGEIVSLPYEPNQIWLYAVAPKSIPTLRSIGATQHLTTVNASIAWLFEHDLMIHFPRNDDERRQFLLLHALVPLAYSLGSIDNDILRYQLAGGMTASLVEVSRATYEVWTASDGRTLGQACELAAERMAGDMLQVETAFLSELPNLLGQGMAFIDLKQ